jgi:hypothetical protein
MEDFPIELVVENKEVKTINLGVSIFPIAYFTKRLNILERKKKEIFLIHHGQKSTIRVLNKTLNLYFKLKSENEYKERHVFLL